MKTSTSLPSQILERQGFKKGDFQSLSKCKVRQMPPMPKSVLLSRKMSNENNSHLASEFYSGVRV